MFNGFKIIRNSRSVKLKKKNNLLDIQAERDILVKKVFPAIDALCRERGTYCAPIDLRWGINESQVRYTFSLPNMSEGFRFTILSHLAQSNFWKAVVCLVMCFKLMAKPYAVSKLSFLSLFNNLSQVDDWLM